MEIVTNPENLPEEEKFYTVQITDNNESPASDYTVEAYSKNSAVNISAGSVALGGDGEGVGFNTGEATLNAASMMMDLEYVDFEEYEYDEVRITFVERDSE
jgi:hypothetical protein